jgi:hypothetical protein
MFIQISRETMLLLINNLHKNVRDNCSFNLRVYSEHSTGKVFLALLYHIIYLLCFASKHHTIIALKKLGQHNSLTPITVGPLQNININIENRNN